MVLGLDLQGGVHFLLQVDQKAALDKRLDAYAEDIRALLRDSRIAYQSVRASRRTTASSPPRPVGRAKTVDQARDVMRARRSPTLGYDVSGNRIAVTRARGRADRRSPTTRSSRTSPRCATASTQLGVAEPIIQRQGADRIVVQLPGVQDTAEAKR